MLTFDEVKEAVSKLTYRPGWRFNVYLHPYEGMHVAIVAEVDDPYNPGMKTVLDIHSPLPPFRDEDQVGEWFLWRLLRIESH